MIRQPPEPKCYAVLDFCGGVVSVENTEEAAQFYASKGERSVAPLYTAGALAKLVSSTCEMPAAWRWHSYTPEQIARFGALPPRDWIVTTSEPDRTSRHDEARGLVTIEPLYSTSTVEHLMQRLVSAQRALGQVSQQHSTLSFLDSQDADAVLGRLQACRQIADAALSGVIGDG